MSLTRRRLLIQNLNGMDEFILECTAGSEGFEFAGTIDETANLPIVSVQFDDNNHQNNAWQYESSGMNDIDIDISVPENTVKTIRVVGAFKSFYPVYNINKTGTNIKILKWYGLSNTIFDGLFYGQTIDYDLVIPDNITIINGRAFTNTSGSVIHTNITNNATLTLPTKINTIVSFGLYDTFFANASNNGSVWSINGNVLALSNAPSENTTIEITIPNGTTKIPNELCTFDVSYPKNIIKINMPTDDLLTEIPELFCAGSGITEFECPASVNKINANAFASSDTLIGSAPIVSVKFNQPAGMSVILPQAGSSSGMFYSKSAREMTVYTDNETIKNYDYASDNITATILHLDGSAWE